MGSEASRPTRVLPIAETPTAMGASLTAGNRLRGAYAGQRTVLGTFLIELPTRSTIKTLAVAGFDFIVLDLEHSGFGIETLSGLVGECHAAEVPAIARVWSLDPGLIGKVLDTGVNGVMVPRVRSVDDARQVVSAARYGPLGERGLAPLTQFAAGPASQATIGDSTLVVLQIEGLEGVAAAGEIASVPGVDSVFVGPYDLSQALGRPGDVRSQEVLDAALKVADACENGTMLGIYVDDPSESREWARRGFRLQTVSFDGRMLLEGARTVIRGARDG